MATIGEIAKEAGVSVMTVSNVLNGRNKEVRLGAIRRAENIREIAHRLNYRPNAAARAVRRGSFGSVGLLLSDHIGRGFLFRDASRTIAEHIHTHDLQLSVARVGDTGFSDEASLPKMVRERVVDGLLVNYTFGLPLGLIDVLRTRQIPSIWMNIKMDYDCVRPDDWEAARMAVEYLSGMGHRRIAYVDYSYSTERHYSSVDRHLGYLQAMEERALEPLADLRPYGAPVDGWQRAAADWLGRSNRPTAVITYGANRAYALYCAALKQGLDVPGDLSILTFHEQGADLLGTQMTTLRIPAQELGRVSVEMVLDKIKCPDIIQSPRALPFELIEGATCSRI